ncbi:pyridoxal phosphate-dependent transferase [Entophlyctis helioformis]|nr:pyridoxal phosphate-dependent transferase [Entophlyctis helioformis]
MILLRAKRCSPLRLASLPPSGPSAASAAALSSLARPSLRASLAPHASHASHASPAIGAIRAFATTGRHAVPSNGSGKVMRLDTINQDVVQFEYAVRGEQAIRAEQLRKQLADKPGTLPFQSIVSCNIGNPQQLKQQPITFYRQVSALVEYPDLMSEKNLPVTSAIFPVDAIQRAKELLKAMGGSSGAYSHSQGIPLVRERVAQFIEARDGYPADPDSIFLTAGASPGVQTVLQTIISHAKVGIMIPIPQYPLYTASIALFQGNAVPYYLDESKDWGMSVAELSRSLHEAREFGLEVRALCVINPGNPTGQCLNIENMREIIEFCKRERIVLLADEVYQTNIYKPAELPFHSFKKVLKSMGPAYDDVELISFHSVSKGTIGECGRRGGYFECTGVDDQVKDMFYKIASVSLCPPVQGQLMVEHMVNPPKPGSPSYELYVQENKGIYESLKRRAERLAAAFNALEGVTCNEAQGAMYLFPRIRLPEKAIQAALAEGKQPDEFYCMALLNATGVCVVAGSGFRQQENTYHFRSTFLPPEEQMDQFIGSIKSFHEGFLQKYA